MHTLCILIFFLLIFILFHSPSFCCAGRARPYCNEASPHQERGLQNGEHTILALRDRFYHRQARTSGENISSKNGFANQTGERMDADKDLVSWKPTDDDGSANARGDTFPGCVKDVCHSTQNRERSLPVCYSRRSTYLQENLILTCV